MLQSSNPNPLCRPRSTPYIDSRPCATAAEAFPLPGDLLLDRCNIELFPTQQFQQGAVPGSSRTISSPHLRRHCQNSLSGILLFKVSKRAFPCLYTVLRPGYVTPAPGATACPLCLCRLLAVLLAACGPRCLRFGRVWERASAGAQSEIRFHNYITTFDSQRATKMANVLCN